MKYSVITTCLVLKIVLALDGVQATSRQKRQGLGQLYQPYQPYYYNLPALTFAAPPTAAAVLRSMGDVEGSDVKGRIMFTQTVGGVVYMWGNVTGLSPGAHGFHVHEFGDTRDGCKSMGAHFNPGLVNHGGPADPYRHVGDLGNLMAGADGVARLQESDHFIALAGPNSIIGRGLVIHANRDDFGRGGDKESLRTGNAGGRVACGVITWVKPEAPYVQQPYPGGVGGSGDSDSSEESGSPEK